MSRETERALRALLKKKLDGIPPRFQPTITLEDIVANTKHANFPYNPYVSAYCPEFSR